MSSKLRFLALALPTIGGSVALYMLSHRRQRRLGTTRMAVYPRPSYGSRASEPGAQLAAGDERVTKCEPAATESEVQVCITKPASLGPAVTRATDACKLLRKAGDAATESFYAIFLNAGNKVIGVQEAHRGNLTGVEVHPREVFRPAILGGAASIIVAHNHPSGDVKPSSDDILLTSRLREAGELVGIPVLDHVIIGDRQCFSMAEHDLLDH